MKIDKKTINTVCGIVFLYFGVTKLGVIFNIASTGNGNVVALIGALIGLVVLPIMGVYALQQKKRGKLLQYLGSLYLGYSAYNALSSLQYSINILSLVSFGLLVAAFFITPYENKKFSFAVKDTVSEAAKTQAQTEKQITIYDQQLRDGILTQEEYDQIMQNRK